MWGISKASSGQRPPKSEDWQNISNIWSNATHDMWVQHVLHYSFHRLSADSFLLNISAGPFTMQLDTCVRVSFDWMGICERARTRMAGLSSSVHRITLIGFIRELKPNTMRAASGCLWLGSVRVCLCVIVFTHTCVGRLTLTGTLTWCFQRNTQEQMDKYSSIRGIISPSVTYFGMDFFFFSLLFFSELTSPMRRHCWSGGCSFTDLRQEEKIVRCCNTTFDPI